MLQDFFFFFLSNQLVNSRPDPSPFSMLWLLELSIQAIYYLKSLEDCIFFWCINSIFQWMDIYIFFGLEYICSHKWLICNTSVFWSMKEIVERHKLHSKNLEKLDQPSLELQVSFLFFLFFHLSIYCFPYDRTLEVRNLLKNDVHDVLNCLVDKFYLFLAAWNNEKILCNWRLWSWYLKPFIYLKSVCILLVSLN